MRAAVIDTNVISYELKHHPIADLYTSDLENTQLLISFQTLAELGVWALEADWGAKRSAAFRRELEGLTVVYATAQTCQCFAAARVSAKRAGKPILAADAWVAAIALELGVPLVTHEPNDFAGVDKLEVISHRG